MSQRGESIVKWATLIVFLVLSLSEITYSGNLDPSAPPGPTMKTLDQIPPTWSQILPGPARFELVMGGEAVLDKETGLVWEKSPDTSKTDWSLAVGLCIGKIVGGRKGWRLPFIEELESLKDPAQFLPALSAGHPFVNVQLNIGNGDAYWSATTEITNSNLALVGQFITGLGPGFDNKSNLSHFYWCVRGGHGL